MASEVDICNLALAGLGDDANISSINPPDGTAQAAHCSRFYPVARDALLEMHSWSFCTKRASLALLTITVPTEWLYAYAAPSDAVNFIAVLDPLALDDYSYGIAPYASATGSDSNSIGVYTPQEYDVEALPDGSSVIYSNQANAVLRYTTIVTDTTQFSPTFILGLSALLQTMLAGPIIKGAEGIKVAQAKMQEFRMWKAEATTSDANQRKLKVAPAVSWMANR